MFWTSAGVTPKIERAYMDGSRRKVIHNTMLSQPNGLVIDYKMEKLYWSDYFEKKIEVSDLNGKNRLMVLPKPDVVGLTLLDGHLYWADRAKSRIVMADGITGRGEEALRGKINDALGMCAVTHEKQTGMNPCGVENGYCTHLCFFRGIHGYVCGCPDLVDNQCSTGGGEDRESTCTVEDEACSPFRIRITAPRLQRRPITRPTTGGHFHGGNSASKKPSGSRQTNGRSICRIRMETLNVYKTFNN
ncbi:unnamed protein product [Nesidiocoris tenuis]|uniref:EGF-like domain-containing protein n=1 Tax=Nesidiocoris tenuis TaxID=355587 RepID=A0A6H5GXX6_9HEMI|nr:unnamed protein product [Nesidiocoris tenuis]